MKKKAYLLSLLGAVLCLACQQPQQQASEDTEVLDIPECVVSTPPDSLGLDSFYTKYVDVNGLPLISSWRVPDSAFTAAHRTLYAMTAMLAPEVLEAMRRSNARVAIMARYEGTPTCPSTTTS